MGRIAGIKETTPRQPKKPSTTRYAARCAADPTGTMHIKVTDIPLPVLAQIEATAMEEGKTVVAFIRDLLTSADLLEPPS